MIDPTQAEWTEALRWSTFMPNARARAGVFFWPICYAALVGWLVMVGLADHTNSATSIYLFGLAAALTILTFRGYYRLLVTRPRSAMNLYRKTGPYRFTFSHGGVSLEAPHLTMTFAWPAFTGYVALAHSVLLPRPNSTYFVIARSAFTDDEWRTVDALIVTNLKHLKSIAT